MKKIIDCLELIQNKIKVDCVDGIDIARNTLQELVSMSNLEYKIEDILSSLESCNFDNADKQISLFLKYSQPLQLEDNLDIISRKAKLKKLVNHDEIIKINNEITYYEFINADKNYNTLKDAYHKIKKLVCEHKKELLDLEFEMEYVRNQTKNFNSIKCNMLNHYQSLIAHSPRQENKHLIQPLDSTFGLVNLGNQGDEGNDTSWVKIIVRWADKYCIDESVLPRNELGLIALRQLELNNYHLRELPVEIGYLTELEVLVLDDNHIEYLPDSIGRLVNIKKLSVRHNNLTNLPENMVNCSELSQLFYHIMT